MKIVMIASEVVPFAKTGGLADVANALPLALEYCGQEVVILMPKYKCVSEGKFRLEKVSKDIFRSNIGKNIKVYFIENELYFNRDGLYGDKNGDYKDNLERFAFFCRRSLELLKEISFCPDILHLHDWQASLAAVYLKKLHQEDKFYNRIRCILTINNIGYQGIFEKEKFEYLRLDRELFSINGLEFYNKVNLLKGGILFADLINTVSPTYAKEIQTKEFGFGLEGLLKERGRYLSGIINGLDYSIWDPNTDEFILQNYSVYNLEDKYFNREGLQKSCGLEIDREKPVLGIVSRLAEQKGFDILEQGLDEIIKMGTQMVILGTGDMKYHQALKAFVKKYPGSFSLNLRFDDPLAHKIYAGSDIFLMPSKYEPCGLGQLISLRYGTIPVAFKTGGLADTINKNNGFMFSDYSKEDLLKTIKKAVNLYGEKEKWKKLMVNAMNCNFSWKASADKYLQLYAKAKEK